MASLLNSIKDSSLGLLATNSTWEDVKDYTNVVITLRSGVDGSATLQWADTSGRRFPTNNDIIATEYLNYNTSGVAITRQYDNRARWFRVLYDNSGTAGTDYSSTSFATCSLNLQTLYKKAPTELKIVDQCANVVSVNVGPSGNSLYTVLTDSSGVLIRTTNAAQTTGNALFVHLADSSGISLATTTIAGAAAQSLFVALRDASNVGIDSTGTFNNALYVRPGDSLGNAQASSFNVSGAAGVALFAALADACGIQIDTTYTRNFMPSTDADKANALYVTLSSSDGRSISASNPLNVINTIPTAGANAFDLSYGAQEFFICPKTDLSSTQIDGTAGKINLYNMFVYNDYATTVWLKVYDVSVGLLSKLGLITSSLGTELKLDACLNENQIKPVYNITVPAGRYRDLVLPGGATFYNGLFVRSTIDYRSASIRGPAENHVFINGSYIKSKLD